MDNLHVDEDFIPMDIDDKDDIENAGEFNDIINADYLLKIIGNSASTGSENNNSENNLNLGLSVDDDLSFIGNTPDFESILKNDDIPNTYNFVDEPIKVPLLPVVMDENDYDNYYDNDHDNENNTDTIENIDAVMTKDEQDKNSYNNTETNIDTLLAKELNALSFQ